jgi:hypothetical protein
MPFRTLSAQRDSRIYTCYNDLKVELIRRRDKKKCYDIHTDHLFVDAAMHDKLNSLVSGHITSWTRRAGTTKFVISDLAAQDSVSELDKNDRDCLAASGLYLTVIRAAKEAFQVLDKAYPHRMEVDSSAPSGGSNLEVVMLCERRPPRVAWNGRNDNNFQAALGIARQVLGVQLPKRRIASPQDLKDRFEQKRIG